MDPKGLAYLGAGIGAGLAIIGGGAGMAAWRLRRSRASRASRTRSPTSAAP